MALHFYFDVGKTNMISDDGSMNNPDLTSGSGTTGYTDEKAIYVGNDTAAKRYEDVIVTAAGDDTDVDFKYALDTSGNPGTYADMINLPNIAANGVVKIWRKVIVKSDLNSQNRVNIKHKLTAKEFAV